jgi:hypothetical protein
MGFLKILKKLRFWRKRNNDALTTCDIATSTDNVTSETCTQVSSIEVILRCDAGTQVDNNLTCEASMQTRNGNEKSEKAADGGAGEREKVELKRKIAALEKFLEEKDGKICKLSATMNEMKMEHRSELQYIKTKKEMDKSSMLQKIRDMRNEIIRLKERRPPPTEREMKDYQGRNRNLPPRLQNRLGPPPTERETDLPELSHVAPW